MPGKLTTEHCPKCGSLLLSDGVHVWCSCVGGRRADGTVEHGCNYGIEERVASTSPPHLIPPVPAPAPPGLPPIPITPVKPDPDDPFHGFIG